MDKDVGEKDGSKDDEKEKHIRGKTWRVSRDSRSSRSRWVPWVVVGAMGSGGGHG